MADLVARPVDPPLAHLGGDVGAALEEQRNAVGEAVHRDAGLGVAAAEADARLDDHRVPFVNARLVGEGGDQLRLQLLHDAQP
jgi:hypothetical protein